MTGRKNRPLIIFFMLLALVLILTATSIYFYRKATRADQGKAEVRSLVSDVSKIMYLPEGETPTIATVSDPEKLGNQPFFADAKLGDKVLIYTNAKKAVLYDPKAKKIVNVAPINLGVDTPGTTTAPSAEIQ